MRKSIPLPINYLIYLLLLAAFILCYYHTFSWLHYKYSYRDSYYSHGYIIPLISAFLIFIKRNKLKAIEPSSCPFGLVILVFSLLIHLFATMGEVNFLSGFSIFFYIVGFSLYLFGRDLTKQIAFPLCFLLFMFPIPSNFINIAGLPSKSLATAVGLKFINLIGIPYLQEGFRINLSNTTLVVGTPCNGMKSLISFAALGLLFTHFIEVTIWKRLIILAAIYPLAILLNGCRLAILVYIANNYGIEKASPDSYLHTLSGMAVFMVGLVVLVLFIVMIEKKKSKKSK